MPDFAFRLSRRTQNSVGNHDVHYYDIHKGEDKVGNVDISVHKKNPSRLNIENIEVNDGPNSIGPSAVRGITKQLKEHYPEAKYVTGKRVSGAREDASGGDIAPRVIQKI